MSFLPICNVCLLEIGSGTQGILLSCGHFVCYGCCRAPGPSICPHCGSPARAAALDHPPAEVQDYLQSPLAQFRASSDVVMFQLEHFRSVAKQASKALHELRLLYSREVRRREETEKEAEELRQRAAKVTDLRGNRRESVGLSDGGGSFVAEFGAGRAQAERNASVSAGVDSNSPIGKLRQRFLGVRSQESDQTSPVSRLLRNERPESRGRENGIGRDPRQTQSIQEPGRGAGVVVSGQSGGGTRPSMSFLAPSSTARCVGQGAETRPNTPRATSGPPPGAPLKELSGGFAEQRLRQQVTTMSQRLETPGRPVRPAWQDTGRMRAGVEKGGGGVQQSNRPSTPRHGPMFSLQVRQQQHPQSGRVQVRSEIKEIRRPTCGQDAAIGRGGRMSQLPVVAGHDPRESTSGSSPSTGSGRPSSSPRSPLLGVGGSLKRPLSGGLPSPKRPGSSSSATERARAGTRQERAGTPLTPLRACPPSPRLRSPQLPFTSRSTPRPGSGQRLSSSSSNGAGRFDNHRSRGAPSTSAVDHQATSRLPQVDKAFPNLRHQNIDFDQAHKIVRQWLDPTFNIVEGAGVVVASQ